MSNLWADPDVEAWHNHTYKIMWDEECPYWICNCGHRLSVTTITKMVNEYTRREREHAGQRRAPDALDGT